MFDISFWELAMIGVVALIVVGPERLPGLARTAGLWLGKARRMLAEIKAEVDRELQLEELKQSLRQQVDQGGMKDLADRVKTLHNDIQAEFDPPEPPPAPPASVTSPVQLQKSTSPSMVPSTSTVPPPPPPTSDQTS